MNYRNFEHCREKRKPVHQVLICYKNHCQYFGLISSVEFVFSYIYFYFTTMFVYLVETMLCICIFIYSLYIIGASLEAQMVKCLPTMRENRVWSLGQEDPLEKEMATHSSTLAWTIPWMDEPGGLQSMGSQWVNMTERLHFHFFIL